MSVSTAQGRRERKKEATRSALADAALRMFIERGYDNVTLREIADAVDVSVTTLMNHFPSKEALVFDREASHEAALLSAVSERPAGVSPLRSLRDHVAARTLRAHAAPGRSEFLELVRTTPALGDYQLRMLMRYQFTLARTIAAATGATDTDSRCAALARFVLDSIGLAVHSDDPAGAVDAAFDILEYGWERS